MSVKYDPDHFPPTESEHIEFSATAESIFMKYDEESKSDVYNEDIVRIGHDVGVSLMANVSDFELIVELADGMNDECTLLGQLPEMKLTFMEAVIAGARNEAEQKLHSQAIDADNALCAKYQY